MGEPDLTSRLARTPPSHEPLASRQRASSTRAHRDPVTARLLALQRTAGNRAVAEMLGSSRTCPTVQRKVGFEIEFSVPSLGPPGGGLQYKKNNGVRPQDTVKSFLDGGVPYGTDIGGAGQPVRIDSDHSSDIDRTPVVDKLKELNVAKGGDPKEPRTRLEYVTHAVDELASGSNKTINALWASVRTHLTSALDKARSGHVRQLDPPAKGGYMTGVAYHDMYDWLKGPTWDAIEPLMADFVNNKVKDEAYLQATVGIIPSGIRSFLAAATRDGGPVTVKPPSEARQQLLELVEMTITALLNRPSVKDHDWYQKAGATSKEAFAGLMTLAYSYILGDVLHKTTGGTPSIVKNAVPFLIKTSPWSSIHAGPHMFSSAPPPIDLLKTAGDLLKVSNFAQQSYWVQSTGTSAKAEGRLTEAVAARTPSKPLITGDYTDFVVALFGGAPAGEVKTIVGKTLPGHDELPADSGGVKVGWESFGQKGIPLEYRWISERHPISGLAAAIVKIVEDVREANLRELTPKQKADVENAIKV
ncbi:MAG: hypothetical protein ACRDS0_25015 [Pseudonocardiaceae bacterium]